MASWNQTWRSEVWLGTRSAMTLMPWPWASAIIVSACSIVP